MMLWPQNSVKVVRIFRSEERESVCGILSLIFVCIYLFREKEKERERAEFPTHIHYHVFAD